MQVIQVSDRPAFQGFYSVAGRLLFIEGSDLRLEKPIEQLFNGWQLTRVSFPEQSPDIRLTFFCDEIPPGIPANLNHFEIAEGGQCYTGRDDLYLDVLNSLVHLRRGDSITVRVWLPGLPEVSDSLLARVTSFAVCAALRRFGVFELHSAAVVCPESQEGVLIVGPSSSGKSTLASQLALAGWPYLSDDEVLLSLADGKVEAHGFRSFFAVGAATASVVGIDQGNSGLKACFEPESVFSSPRRARATPGVLLFTRLSGEFETQINRLSPSESMTRLLRACPWATYDTAIAGANLEVLSRLAQQTSSFDLMAGRDLLEPGAGSVLLSRCANL